MTPRVLIIAGSDSGGGAGIQADIRTVTMLGGHATTAVTAITAQNTLGVQAVHPVPAEMVLAQIDSVAGDIGVDAVKIGMVGSAATVHALADRLAAMAVPIVFDPVMVASSGSRLADAETIAAFERLMAFASVVTPNLPELAALGGEAAVRERTAALLVKGGHAEGGRIEDRLIERDGTETRWSADRIETRHTHGTGCTLASAIAVGLAEGMTLPAAVARARGFVRLALRSAPGIGGGHGPMGHQAVRLDLGSGPRFNQVTLPGGEGCEAFYTALGLRRIVATGHGYARFESEGGGTLSVEAGAPPTVFLECDDLDATLAALAGRGIAAGPAVDQPWLWREARVTDPAGNAVCLYQAGENRRFPPWRLA